MCTLIKSCFCTLLTFFLIGWFFMSAGGIEWGTRYAFEMVINMTLIFILPAILMAVLLYDKFKTYKQHGKGC